MRSGPLIHYFWLCLLACATCLTATAAQGGRALAAPQAVGLTGNVATGLATSGTATVYADGFTLAYNGGSIRWQQVEVINVATQAAAAVCPGINCTVTEWNTGNVKAATVRGLQPGSTYSIFITEINTINESDDETLVPSLTMQSPAGLLSIGGPSGYPPLNPAQIDLTLSADTVEGLTWTIVQSQLGPDGAQVPFSSCPQGSTLGAGNCQYSVAVAAAGSATLTTSNQQSGALGYVYRYTASASGYAAPAVLFANAPTYDVHRRTRGLFVTWPDEGNGAQYEVFGGPGIGACGAPTFTSGLLPVGTTQWSAVGLLPNTEYSVCMWAEIPGQSVTPNGWLPTWWPQAGNANGNGMWYTLPDVPGQLATGGLLAAYYDIPALAGGGAGPPTAIFGGAVDYTAVQGPINFRTSCNCATSWPYAGHDGPMPSTVAGDGTAQAFGAKYLGWLYAPTTGVYTIGCRADDACQAWVNGRLVADGMMGSGSSPNFYGACNACGGVLGSISLSAGDWYPLEIDYTQATGGGSIDFFWVPPGAAQSDVPPADLAYPVLAVTQGGTADQASLSWAPGDNPAGTTYELTQDILSPAGAVTGSPFVHQSTATTFTTTNLQPGLVTQYAVRAISGDGLGTPATTEPGGGGLLDVVAPPPDISAPASSTQLAVSWPDVGNGAHYAVIWSTQSDFAAWSGSGDIGAGVGRYTIAGMVPNTEYFVALDAWISESSGIGGQGCMGGSGGGCWWTGATGGGQWTLANPPTEFQATGAANALNLSWNSNGNPPSTLYTWTVTPVGASTDVVSGAVTASQGVAGGLACQSGYTATVDASNGAGVATSSVQLTAETGLCPPAPEVGLAIDNGLAQTASRAVTLDVNASDVSYVQSDLRMRFSNDGGNWSTWGPFASTSTWAINGGKGPNTVYVQVRDPGGGVGSATATITYEASISPLSGQGGNACRYQGLSATCVKSPLIAAAFTMPAESVSMEVSFDNTNWSQPQDAAGAINLVLPSGDGLKAVFARYFNAQNIASAEGPDYFLLETTPPRVNTVGWLGDAAVTDNGSAVLVIDASDAFTPGDGLQVNIGGASTWSGLLPSDGEIPLTLAGSGYVTVIVTVSDGAGNSTSAEAGIYNP